jgi:predicted amidohydrolase
MIPRNKQSWGVAIGGWLGLVLYTAIAGAGEAGDDTKPRAIKVALAQFDTVPEKTKHNLDQMERLARSAVKQGARWVIFHEGSLTDYTARLNELAEPVPDGPSCQRIIGLARDLNCFISFGMSERDGVKVYITQVFVGPKGLVYKYRKSWLWRSSDKGYRNEWARYDTGTGPERFQIDGITATCFICADGAAPRCITRAALLRPQVVFYPNNRASLPDFPEFGAYAKKIGAPMLVTNRVGKSWDYECNGGCVVFDAKGNVLAKANRNGEEEVLYYTLTLPAAEGP